MMDSASFTVAGDALSVAILLVVLRYARSLGSYTRRIETSNEQTARRIEESNQRTRQVVDGRWLEIDRMYDEMIDKAQYNRDVLDSLHPQTERSA